MKLKCENIGKLSSAEVEINTLTLIAGLNATGKSTVGKLLYCIFNSFYRFEENAERTLKSFLANLFLGVLFPPKNWDDCIEELYKLRFSQDKDLIKKTIHDFYGDRFSDSKFSSKRNEQLIDRIVELLNLTDDEIYKRILQTKFISEFGNQIQNIFSEKEKASVILSIKDNDISVSIKNDEIYGLKNFQDLQTEVIYIDDPFVLDNLSTHRSNIFTRGNHKVHLYKKLVSNIINGTDMDIAIKEILATKQLGAIYELIDSVCNGNIVQETNDTFVFQYEKSKKRLDIVNLSTGLKTFSIIKTLLMNGTLTQNGVIILDEPEIHLHPAWQKLFAEIIVLLQVKFNMHILLNSHSPYFINAIDLYAKKYKIRETCKFYLTRDTDDTHTVSELVDVSDNIEEINKLLFTPLQEMEDERSEIEDAMSGENDD